MLFQNAKSTIFKDYPVDLIEPTDDEWQKLEDGILRLVDKMRRQNLIDASIEAHALSQDVLYEFTGLGPVEYYLTDDSIRRIFIHDPRKIFLKKDKEKISAPKKFSCHEALMRTILRLVRPLGFTMKDIPLKASGKLPDGTSWQIIMPPLAPAGPIITFEKPRKSVKNMEEQVRDSMLTDEIVEYFQKAITSRKNLLICGRNKNTRISLLNSIIQLIPANERTVLVEKQSEFHCTAEDVIVIDKAEAARNSINIFPILPSLKGDRVLWGNIEPEEIAPFLKEILNGLEGTLATAYAFSVDDLVKRFVLQLQLSLGSIDQETARALLYSTTNIIVIVSDFPDGKRRITEIAEIPADIHPDQYPPLIFKFIYEGIDQQGNVLGKIVRI
jgi:pilus assembly protein CpaF